MSGQTETFQGGKRMDIWRAMGVAIVFGVLAIIGAGLVWHLAGDWQIVFTYLGLLGFILLAVLFNPEQLVNEVLDDEHGEE
jgi:MFS family permease